LAKPLRGRRCYAGRLADADCKIRRGDNQHRHRGRGRSTSDGVVRSQAFLLDHGTYTALAGPSGAVRSAAYGISDSGAVVGSYFSTIRLHDAGHPFAAGPARGFIYASSLTWLIRDRPDHPSAWRRVA
jgi:hypothetical protein